MVYIEETENFMSMKEDEDGDIVIISSNLNKNNEMAVVKLD